MFFFGRMLALGRLVSPFLLSKCYMRNPPVFTWWLHYPLVSICKRQVPTLADTPKIQRCVYSVSPIHFLYIISYLLRRSLKKKKNHDDADAAGSWKTMRDSFSTYALAHHTTFSLTPTCAMNPLNTKQSSFCWQLKRQRSLFFIRRLSQHLDWLKPIFL